MTSDHPEAALITSPVMDGREEYGEYSLASPGYRGSMASYPGQYPGEEHGQLRSSGLSNLVQIN